MKTTLPKRLQMYFWLKKLRKSNKKCVLCNQKHHGWPHKDSEGYLCQDCWEDQCDKSWWDELSHYDWIEGYKKWQKTNKTV